MNDLLYIAVKFYYRQHGRAFKVCGGPKCQSIWAESSCSLK